jgi:8-amino-7-oxononanoate synthase
MDGDRCPLPELVALAERYGAQVIVDEAHATGCFGSEGAGLVAEAGLRGRVLATVHTGGKALGVPGAYVCGPALLRDLLVNRCRHFLFTTALPAEVASWWLYNVPRVRTAHAARKALHENAAGFRRELARHGVTAGGEHYVVPVVLGPDRLAVAVAQEVAGEAFDIPAIRPPSVPAGSARLRVSVHANHSEETLRDAAFAIAEAIRRARNDMP